MPSTTSHGGVASPLQLDLYMNKWSSVVGDRSYSVVYHWNGESHQVLIDFDTAAKAKEVSDYYKANGMRSHVRTNM